MSCFTFHILAWSTHFNRFALVEQSNQPSHQSPSSGRRKEWERGRFVVGLYQFQRNCSVDKNFYLSKSHFYRFFYFSGLFPTSQSPSSEHATTNAADDDCLNSQLFILTGEDPVGLWEVLGQPWLVKLISATHRRPRPKKGQKSVSFLLKHFLLLSSNPFFFIHIFLWPFTGTQFSVHLRTE